MKKHAHITIYVCSHTYVYTPYTQESFQLLRQMRGDGARADVQTYNTLMVVCCKAGQPERAVQVCMCVCD